MSRLTTISWGADQFRVGPWHADPTIAYAAVAPNVSRLSLAGVDQLVDRLRTQGYRGVVTAALRDHERAVFAHAGFTEREQLVVLAHALESIPDRLPLRLRRGRRGDRRGVVSLDHGAFEDSWQLDLDGLAEAISATPHSRFRVAPGAGGVIGYAVSGRAGRVGYVQRLAVAPSARRRHAGAALVIDALWWFRRRGASVALVNTQESNAPALALYDKLGFTIEPTRLTVMQRAFDA